MTYVLEDMKMKYEEAQRLRGLDTVILKARYNIFLGHAICNIKVELVEAVKNAICLVPAD